MVDNDLFAVESYHDCTVRAGIRERGDRFKGNNISQKLNTDKTLHQKKEPQEIVMAYLYRNNNITNKKARQLTGLTADGVKSLFRRMIEQNLLIKMGEKRGTHYLLKTKDFISDE